MLKKMLCFLYFFLCASMLFSITALAYIDPSAMTYMIQLIAGIAIAAGAGFGFYFRKIRRHLSKFTKKDRAADLRSYEEDDDDDDIGYGDYEIDDASTASAQKAAIFNPASEPALDSFAETCGTLDQAAPALDPYDEMGGEGGLIAENRRLRRLLAEEQQKVELLKQALHICTASKK